MKRFRILKLVLVKYFMFYSIGVLFLPLSDPGF